MLLNLGFSPERLGRNERFRTPAPYRLELSDGDILSLVTCRGIKLILGNPFVELRFKPKSLIFLFHMLFKKVSSRTIPERNSAKISTALNRFSANSLLGNKAFSLALKTSLAGP
jgi:hypothetical protein